MNIEVETSSFGSLYKVKPAEVYMIRLRISIDVFVLSGAGASQIRNKNILKLRPELFILRK